MPCAPHDARAAAVIAALVVCMAAVLGAQLLLLRSTLGGAKEGRQRRLDRSLSARALAFAFVLLQAALCDLVLTSALCASLPRVAACLASVTLWTLSACVELAGW